MQSIIEILSAFMMWYISLTNTWAFYIENLFINEPTDEITQPMNQTQPTSQNNQIHNTISTILRSNLAYQRASLQSVPTPSISTNNIINALVNILCTSNTKSHIRTTTGTGFFIHSDGVILTNAHVAQYLLLTYTDASDTKCVIQTGSPAAPQYEVDILYLSPNWLVNNADSINSINPTGTGEQDFALLYVTKSVDNSPLPEVFSALPIDTKLLPKSIINSTVYATGYPTEALILNGLDTNLIPKQASTNITELFTLGTNYADVISLSGSTLGKHGSSGGPVTTADNRVIGMITTKGNDLVDGNGSLRAITLSYVDRSIKAETGFPLENIISGDLALKAEVFTQVMVPFLNELIQTKNLSN